MYDLQVRRYTDTVFSAKHCGKPCTLSGGHHFLCHCGSLAPSTEHRMAQSELQESRLCRQSVCEAAGCNSACRKPGSHKGKHSCRPQDEDGHFAHKLTMLQDEDDLALRGKKVGMYMNENIPHCGVKIFNPATLLSGVTARIPYGQCAPKPIQA